MNDLLKKLVLTVLISQLVLSGMYAANVRDFGAVGDGVADDTEAIEKAIREGEGSIEFPKGDYRITRTIEVLLSEGRRIGLDGRNGAGRIVMEGAGPAFRFIGTHDGTALATSFAQGVLGTERMPQVVGLEIFGANPEADGLEFIKTMQLIVSETVIRDVRYGIRLSERNRNVIIDASHIYNCGKIGILFDHVDLHQAVITGNHISYNKVGGIVLLGGAVRNLHITGNDIEYNYDNDAKESNDILIDVGENGSVREGTIVGNTIQARPSPGGANVRFRGNPNTPDKIGLWSITGNHISNQLVNIHLDNARGVAISGNTFILGREHNLLIENSRHISVSGSVSDYNPDYYRVGLYKGSKNGITIRNSEGVILNGFLLEGSMRGSPEAGGSIDIIGSRDVMISGSQILNSSYRGIYVADSRNVQITNNTIRGKNEEGVPVAAVDIRGKSRNVIVRNNFTGTGDAGAIVAEPGTAIVEGNIRDEEG